MPKITKNYQKILHTLKPIYERIERYPKLGRKPKIFDIEVIALSFTAEYMSIDSENSLFTQLKDSGKVNLIERSQFNKRRRQLFGLSEKVRRELSRYFVANEDYFIVDSMPMEAIVNGPDIRERKYVNRIIKLTLKKGIVLHRIVGFMATSFMEYYITPCRLSSLWDIKL